MARYLPPPPWRGRPRIKSRQTPEAAAGVKQSSGITENLELPAVSYLSGGISLTAFVRLMIYFPFLKLHPERDEDS
jgi:hypothetical protein